jgi:hypothetical protein
VPGLYGDAHAAAAFASSLQVVPVTLEPVPLVLKETETGLPTVDPFAGELIVTVGTSESTVKLTVSEPEPAELLAVTTTVCAPCARPV